MTWSYSEANDKYASWYDKIAYNIAVVFNGAFPIYFKGREVVNGDESDLRFLDKRNVVVGLKAKGKARHDKAIAIRLLLKDQTGAAPEKVCKRMQMFETFDVIYNAV